MEKGKEAGGLGKNALLPPLACIQNRGRGGSGTTWPAGRVLAGGPCSVAAGRRGKRRGRRGGSIPVLTLSWGGAWTWIGGRRRTAGWAALVAARCGAGGKRKGLRRCEVRWGMQRGSL
jgi:hypothetical protein